ncbi:MAG: hypothetical protein ABSB29_06690 [Nitrososphaerales archaeon]
MSVSYVVNLSQHYSVLSAISQRISVEVSVITVPHSVQAHVAVSFPFAYLGYLAPPGVNPPTVIVLSQHPLFTQVLFSIPSQLNQFNVTVLGQTQDYSLLYRDTATLPYASVHSDVSPYAPTSYNLVIPVQPRTQYVSVVPFGAYPLPPGANRSLVSEVVQLGGREYLTAVFSSNFARIMVLYQPSLRDYSVFFYAAILVVLVIMAPFLYRGLRPKLPRAVSVISTLLWRVVTWFNARRLLGIFALSLALMVGLAIVFGPAPAPRLYLAATPSAVSAIGPPLSKAGYLYFTPLDAGDQFNTMTSLGMYQAVVIVDYSLPMNSLGLYAVNSIYINASNLPSYAHTLTAVFGTQKVINFSTQRDLLNDITGSHFYAVSNRLGLSISTWTYNKVLWVEGVLTVVTTFAALAYFSRAMVESGAKGWVFLAEAAVLPLLVFMFTTMIFIQTSVLLGLPVALHAAISQVESASGIVGFGGGSRPRELAGVLGFLFGAVVGPAGRTKLDRIGFLVFAGVLVFLVTDPLSIGSSFYSLLQNLMTSESGGTAGLAAQEGTRDFLGNVMDFYGRYISPFFYSSHGAVLFYVGAFPFAIFARLRKTTATLLLLFSSLAASIGFIRVADLNAAEALASPVPGLTLGIVVMAAFLLLSLGESQLRKLFS